MSKPTATNALPEMVIEPMPMTGEPTQDQFQQMTWHCGVSYPGDDGKELWLVWGFLIDKDGYPDGPHVVCDAPSEAAAQAIVAAHEAYREHQ